MYHLLQTGLFLCPSSISEHNLNINGVCSGSVKPTGSSSSKEVTRVPFCIKVQIYPRGEARDHLKSLSHLCRPPERQLERNHDSPPTRGDSTRAVALRWGTETPWLLPESLLKWDCYLRGQKWSHDDEKEEGALVFLKTF